MWFSKSLWWFSLYSIGFCLPAKGILVPPNGTSMLIRSKISIKFQGFVRVVFEKAQNSCNGQKEDPNVVFFVPHGVFSLYSRCPCLRPNGILVLIRSKLSMKFQCIVQVVLEKAIESYRGYKGHAKVVFRSPSDCISFSLEAFG